MKYFLTILLLVSFVTGGELMGKVICKECKAEGKKSTVTVVGQSTTLMATHQWYDEDGNYHFSDPNITTTTYRCSRGHTF